MRDLSHQFHIWAIPSMTGYSLSDCPNLFHTHLRWKIESSSSVGGLYVFTAVLISEGERPDPKKKGSKSKFSRSCLIYSEIYETFGATMDISINSKNIFKKKKSKVFLYNI